MLKLEDVKFPIKFRGIGCGEITFTDEDKGTWDTGEVSQLGIGWFINGHNKVNPENSANKGYHYVMSGGPGLCGVRDGWKDWSSNLSRSKARNQADATVHSDREHAN